MLVTRIGLIALVLAMLEGCSAIPSASTPTQFFGLTYTGSVPAQVSGGLRLGVGPVQLPEMLKRPQIVARGAGQRVDISDFHHWAGELEAGISRVLAQRLEADTVVDMTLLYPWPGARPVDYQVRVDIIRFDGVLGKEVALQGNWALLDSRGRNELLGRTFLFTQALDGEEYDAYVAGLNQLVIDLGGEIAAAIREKAAQQ